MKPQIAMLAAYNEWVNRRLYDAAAALPDADYRADRGAFFGSLHATLNHLLVGDRIWLRRLTGQGEAPDRLDAILHDDFHELRAARQAEDARIVTYVAALSDADLGGIVRYRTTRQPTEIAQPLLPLLLHFFNHQTHHRGQAHCLLTGLKGEAPSFDLLTFQRQTGIGLLAGQGGSFAEPERKAP